MRRNAKTTRKRLIETGAELMHRHGYNATGLTAILDAADLPKGCFYHHFGSKEDFAVAALEDYAARKAKHSAAFLTKAKLAPLKRLKFYFEDLAKSFGQKRPLPGCMIGRFSLETAADSLPIRTQVKTSFARWQAGIASVIQQAVSEKELPPDTDPDLLAGFILNSWEGALVRSQAENSDAPLDMFMHYIFEGLLTKQSKFKAKDGPTKRTH